MKKKKAVRKATKKATKKAAVRSKPPAKKRHLNVVPPPKKAAPVGEVKRGRGRPAVSEAKRHTLRTENLQVKCSAGELTQMKKTAAQAGFLVFSNWLRDKLGLPYEEPTEKPERAPKKPRTKKAEQAAEAPAAAAVVPLAVNDAPAAKEEAPI